MILVLCVPFAATSAQAHDHGDRATGADRIFASIGQDTPADWQSWSRSERHAYFQSMGLYPDNGSKYQGHVSDLSGYFAWLGVDQPNNWGTMTNSERKKFVANINAPTPPETGDTLPDWVRWLFLVGLLAFAALFVYVVNKARVRNV